MGFPTVPQYLLIEWLNGLVRVPIGGRPVVRTGVQVSVFSGRLHRIPRTYPRFWAGLRALKLPIYPFFGPAYRPGPPRFIRTAGRPLCVYSGVLLRPSPRQCNHLMHRSAGRSGYGGLRHVSLLRSSSDASQPGICATDGFARRRRLQSARRHSRPGCRTRGSPPRYSRRKETPMVATCCY